MRAVVVLAAVFGFSVPVWANEVVPLTVDRIFTPEGFDDNDNAQVVLDGWLSNSCDETTEATFVVHEEARIIEVTAQAHHDSFHCLPVRTRYTTVVDIGVLSFGSWEVVTNNGWLKETLVIGEAPSAGPDGEAYAQIDEVSVEAVGETDQWEVVLTGTFQHSCQQLKDVKVIDSGDSFEVLPILSPEPRSLQCLPALETFETSVLLPVDLQEGRYLVHVRSRSRAFNEVITVGSDE